jgi:predicted DNA-binding transcriptional regulator AlpA
MASSKVVEATAKLPAGITVRCLSKSQAAAYIGVSVNTFSRMVQNNEAPKPIQISQRRLVWDVKQLDALIDSFSGF